MKDRGAIPLPTGRMKVLFDLSGLSESTPQPEAQQLASFDAVPNDECPNGKTLDINQQFIAYAVKNGLIRVLHRRSTLKALLRGHEGTKVTDIQFFNQGDVLGTVGGNVNIWRVFELSHEIVAEKLMEIPATLPNITRLKWHPFNPNLFWLFHHNGEGKTVATLVESTKMTTMKHPTEVHALCILHGKFAVMEGAIQLAGSSDITDLDWSSGDARHVMTTHDDGSIRLWDTKTPAATNADGTVAATCKAVIQEKLSVTRGFFMTHENILSVDGIAPQLPLTTCFCTAAKGNSEITVWSPFTETGQPTKLQVFGIDDEDASYNLAFITPPPNAQPSGTAEPPVYFFMLSDRRSGKIFALHLKSIWSSSTPQRPIAVGIDYIVPFLSKYATFSWCVSGRPADATNEDFPGMVNFDVLICALQTKAVQHMVLPHYMCNPPSSQWDYDQRGVTIQPLETGASVAVDDNAYEDYEEDYEKDNDDESEEHCPPEASSLPTPDSMGDLTGAGIKPFANWLGAIAVKSRDYDQRGVTIQPLETGASVAVDDNAYEDYEEDNDDESEEYCPPEASSLPTPDGMGDLTGAGTKPFANWLGAIAAKSSTSSSVPTLIRSQSSPPVPQTPFHTPAATPLPGIIERSMPPGLMTSAAVPILPENQSTVLVSPLLSPVEIMSGNSTTSQEKKPQRGRSPKGAKTKKTTPASVAAAPPGGKITILKKESPESNIINVPLPPIPSQMMQTTTPPALSGDWEESLKTMMSAQFKSYEKNLLDEIQRQIKSEVTNTLLPEVVNTLSKTMEQSVAKSLQASMDKSLKQSGDANTDAIMTAICGSVEQPLKEAFAESMKSILIPAYESATREIMFQVSSNIASTKSADNSSDFSAKFDAMAKAISNLTAEVTQLRALLNSDSPAPQVPRTAPPPSPVDPMESTRKNILSEIQAGNYEIAFTKALSLSTTDMAIFCCKHTDLSAVLGGEKPVLSQPILLCLMQQLGAAIAVPSSSDLDMSVSWLQEIALTLDPANESIARHVPNVLQQLVGIINTKMKSDPFLRRRLQMLLQVIRGML